MKNKILKLTLLVISFVPGIVNAQQRISDGTGNATINSSAILELQSTNKGFLPSRVALTDRLLWAPMAGTATSGMIVYNTASGGANGLDTGLVVWEGQWNALSNSSQSDYWRLKGNASTLPPTILGGVVSDSNFVGTTDAKNLAFATNSITRAILDQQGNLLSGSGNPLPGSGSTNNMVTGNNNTILAAVKNSSISGSNNTVGGTNPATTSSANLVIGGMSNKVYNTNASAPVYTAIFGQSNVDSNSGGLITGTSNLNTAGSYATFISGTSNILRKTSNAIISGSSNIASPAGLGSLTAPALFGNGNMDSASYTLMAGLNNIISSNADRSAVFGFNNIIGSNATDNLVSGFNNKLTNTGGRPGGGFSYNAVSGISNQLITASASNTVGNVVSGENNIVYNVLDGAVFGVSNTDSSRYTLIAGQGNIISAAMNYATVVGKYNQPVDNSLMIIGNGNSSVKSNAITVYNTPGVAATANNSTLNVNGSFSLPIKSVTADYTVANTDYKIMVRTTGTANTTISLPDPTTCGGRIYVVQNMNPNAFSGSNGGVAFNYDIDAGGGVTTPAGTAILMTAFANGGSAATATTVMGTAITLQSDGAVWTGIAH
ncbi:beta strand repeat-containing protein [Chitinophagaceae bacterium MMS25-I14]